MSAAGAGIGLLALGQIAGGINAQKQAEFQAAQMREQAKVVEAQALQQQRQLVRERGRFRAQQITQTAASGVQLTGSPLDAIAESEASFAIDQSNIQRNAQARYASLITGARAQQLSGTAALTGSLLGAGGTVLSRVK